MTKTPDWIFLCDGDDRTGLGHVGRCLGYAEMLADSGRLCVFRGRYQAAATDMIGAAGFGIQPTEGIHGRMDEAPSLGAVCGLLVDSYQAGEAFLKDLRARLEAGAKLLVMDDFAGLTSYDCDGLVNFTLGAKARTYPPGPAVLHLGLEFFPARRWLRRLRLRLENRPPAEIIRRVLIAAGGRDTGGVIPRFLSLLTKLGGHMELGVLVGDDAAARANLEAWLPMPFHVEIIPRQADLEHWLGWADACLCGGGLVKYECLYAGVPVLSMAQNQGQAQDSDLMAAEGLIADLGDVAEFELESALPLLRRFFEDADWRVGMVNRGLACVGGSSGTDGLRPFL